VEHGTKWKNREKDEGIKKLILKVKQGTQRNSNKKEGGGEKYRYGFLSLARHQGELKARSGERTPETHRQNIVQLKEMWGGGKELFGRGGDKGE